MKNTYTLPFIQAVVADSGILEKTYVLRIRDMPSEDKPREKLFKYGPETLSTTELIAIILNTGTKKEDVLTMAARVVREYGERVLTAHTDCQKLATELDIPPVKAAQVVACAELGRRFFQKSRTGLSMLRTGKDVYQYTREMQFLPKEYLRGIYLNTHYRVIHDEVISIGTIDTNIIHPREVFKPAIEYNAAAIILVHNHPSGIVKPSQADETVTKQLIEVSRVIGIPIIDHIIVGKEKFSSIEAVY